MRRRKQGVRRGGSNLHRTNTLCHHPQARVRENNIARSVEADGEEEPCQVLRSECALSTYSPHRCDPGGSDSSHSVKVTNAFILFNQTCDQNPLPETDTQKFHAIQVFWFFYKCCSQISCIKYF